MNDEWIINPKKSDDLVENLLLQRGITNRELFFNPDFLTSYDPLLINDMEIALKQLKSTIESKGVIGIWGDYDVDGVTGSALLCLGLRQCGAEKIEIYIPKREEGYGLSKTGLGNFLDRGIDLLITVDCGISNSSELADLKIPVIITDHHQPPADLPNGYLLNPKLSGRYPFNELCGAAVAYKLLQGLSKHFKQLDQRWLKWHLDLVALATVCDMVPLIDENRLFTKLGLLTARKSKNLGLKALIESASLDIDKINSDHFGFNLGPRLNAISRIGEDPMMGFRLLTTNDENEARSIAEKLAHYNSVRQLALDEAMDQAETRIAEGNWLSKTVIILADRRWPPGLIGLIAGRLVEKYARPAVIFSRQETILKGSARTIRDFPLPAVFNQLGELLVSWGGHEQAAGLTIDSDRFDLFSQRLLEISEYKLKNYFFKKKIIIDSVLTVTDVTSELITELEMFQPFGLANPRPKFVLSDIRIAEKRFVGQGEKHAALTLVQNDSKLKAIAFNQGEFFAGIKPDDRLELAVMLEANFWQGIISRQANVISARPV